MVGRWLQFCDLDLIFKVNVKLKFYHHTNGLEHSPGHKRVELHLCNPETQFETQLYL